MSNDIVFTSPKLFPPTEIKLCRIACNNLRITVTEELPEADSVANKASAVIESTDELQFINTILACYNAKPTWYSGSKLELIEWHPLNVYRDGKTGMPTMTNPPSEPGPVMLLLKDGSIVLDNYCVEEFVHTKSGETRQLHYFDENGLENEEIRAWTEVPTGYKRESK